MDGEQHRPIAAPPIASTIGSLDPRAAAGRATRNHTQPHTYHWRLQTWSEWRSPQPATLAEAAMSSSGEADNFRRSLVQTVWAVASATAFGLILWYARGRDSAIAFFSGYLVEQSLSVDNLFVFIMLFEYFRVPPAFQQRVLSWGIVGAILMRGVMIVAGVAAVKRFRWTSLLFAGILLLSSVKLLMEGDEDEDVGDNLVMRLSRKLVGATTEYDGDRFFTVVDGAKRATPLLLCLVCVELSDVVFAVDSVPAVFGVTEDPFLVYTSNMFAILGLRAWYGVLSKAADDLAYLEKAVAVVLGFVGLKLGFGYFGYDIETGQSLAVIATVLGAGILASIYFPPDEGEESP